MSELQNEPDAAGGRGDAPREEPYLSPVQENKIVASMLNKSPKKGRRWSLEERHKATAIRVTMANMLDEDGRVSNAAVANMIRMESQNQADEHHAEGETVTHNHTGTIELSAVRQEMLKDANYIDYCRTHQINGDSGTVRSNGESGPLENGAAPGSAGPGHNGHLNGNGRH